MVLCLVYTHICLDSTRLVLVVFHYSGIPPQCAWGCYSNVGQKSRNVICMQNKHNTTMEDIQTTVYLLLN